MATGRIRNRIVYRDLTLRLRNSNYLLLQYATVATLKEPSLVMWERKSFFFFDEDEVAIVGRFGNAW